MGALLLNRLHMVANSSSMLLNVSSVEAAETGSGVMGVRPRDSSPPLMISNQCKCQLTVDLAQADHPPRIWTMARIPEACTSKF